MNDNYATEGGRGKVASMTDGADYLTKKTFAKHRLEYLRAEICAERISYEELAELRALTKYIDPSDIQLLEWADVPEPL